MEGLGFTFNLTNNTFIIFFRFFSYSLKTDQKIQEATKGYLGNCISMMKISSTIRRLYTRYEQTHEVKSNIEGFECHYLFLYMLVLSINKDFKSQSCRPSFLYKSDATFVLFHTELFYNNSKKKILLNISVSKMKITYM